MEMNDVIEKIQKCLELGRRGGTEAEAEAAMAKVQILLAKHNLSMADIEDKGKAEETGKFGKTVRGVEVWHRSIYTAIAKLYFCGYFYQSYDEYSTGRKRRYTSHFIIGKPSNVKAVENMVAYLLQLGDRLAEQHEKYDMRIRNSFKKGFASRIHSRVIEQIAKACKNTVKDESTGKELIISPLYVQAKQEVASFYQRNGIKLGRGTSVSISSSDGYYAGQRAAEGVSLNGDSRGIGGSVRRIQG